MVIVAVNTDFGRNHFSYFLFTSRLDTFYHVFPFQEKFKTDFPEVDILDLGSEQF